MVPWSILTRGERNHNPGNIRESKGDRTQWDGERATDDDPAFEEFETPYHGIRALARILLNYERRRGLKSIREMIQRWAPSSENDTDAYVRSVVQRVGRPADAPLDLAGHPATLVSLAAAIIIHENGRNMYSFDLIVEAVDAAYDR